MVLMDPMGLVYPLHNRLANRPGHALWVPDATRPEKQLNLYILSDIHITTLCNTSIDIY